MAKFFDLYDSFDDFYETFLRGNEIEFLYEGERYCILPTFNDSKKADGVIIGKAYDDHEQRCASMESLYNATIADRVFGDILEKIEIVWNNL